MWKQLLATLALTAAAIAPAAPAMAHPETVGYYGQPDYYGQPSWTGPVTWNRAGTWNAHGNGGNWRPATYTVHRRGGIVLNQTVDFFVAPSIGAPMIACMQPGTPMTLLGRGGGWAKVRSKWGTVGYIPDVAYYY